MKSQATSRDTAAARLQGEPNHRSTRDSRTHQPKRRGGETHTLKYSTENTRGDGDGSGSVGAGVHPRRSGRSGGREKFTQKITRTRLLSSHLFAGRQAGRQQTRGWGTGTPRGERRLLSLLPPRVPRSLVVRDGFQLSKRVRVGFYPFSLRQEEWNVRPTLPAGSEYLVCIARLPAVDLGWVWVSNSKTPTMNGLG